MRKIIALITFITIISAIFPASLKAQGNSSLPAVLSLDVVYEIGVDSQVSVSETIKVDLQSPSELVRIIPKTTESPDGNDKSYSIKGLTAYKAGGAKITFDSDENNDEIIISLTAEQISQSGGEITLKYKIQGAIEETGKKDDLNIRNNIELLGVIGILGKIDKYPIKTASVKVLSPYAEIGSFECYAGDVKAGQRMCLSGFDKNSATASSTYFLGEGRAFQISFKLMKGGDVDAPGKGISFVGRVADYLRVNWKGISGVILGILLVVFILKKVIYVKRNSVT